MKKLFLLFSFALILIVVLTGCGSKNTPTNTTAPAVSNEPAASAMPMESSTAPVAATGKTEEITVTARDFAFDKNVIKVKKGDKIKLTLVNKSGAHGLEIHDYKINLATAGTVEFLADKVGEFKFNCSVYCGTGHEKMVGKFIVA